MIQPIIDSSGVIHLFKGKQSEPIKLVIGEILTAEIMDIFPTGTIQIKINNRIINAQPQRELPLSKGDNVMIKVEKPLEDGTIPLRVLSPGEIENLQRFFLKNEHEISDSILKLIQSVFSQKTTTTKQNEQFPVDAIKAMLTLPTESLSKQNKTLLMEKIIDLLFSKKTTTENLQEFIKILEQNNFSKHQIEQIKNIIIKSQEELSPEKLKEALLKSGVSFEAKMKQALNDSIKIEQIREDLKIILYQIAKEAKAQGYEEVLFKAEQLLRQIEAYQILSKTYQSFFTFLPLLWHEIEGGNIAYKSLKREGKEYHTIFVTLNFREESLSFLVTMINKNFYLSFAGNPDIISSIKGRESELKERFQVRGMNLSSINYVLKIEELINKWNIKEENVSLTV